MRNLILLFAIAGLFVSCNQADKQNVKGETAENEIVANLITVEDALASPEKFKDTEVKITGMVTHVCTHGGQKLFIIGDDPELQLRINVGEQIPEFDVALEGSTVEFTGTLKILEADLTETLAQENADKDHHSGDEAHAAAESASYFIEASTFKEITTEI